MPIERIIDEQAVEAAEFARKHDDVLLAAKLAGMGLGLKNSPLTPHEIAELSFNERQIAILACLSRLYVDPLKTHGGKAKNPRTAISSLIKASSMIDEVYRHPVFFRKIQKVTQDHRGREHHFAPSMRRDTAKTAFTAAVFFQGKEAENLVLLGEGILEMTYNKLNSTHPLKPLIGIELKLSKLSRGEKVSVKSLFKDFQVLVETREEVNQHEVATVASWLVAWGFKLKNDELRDSAGVVFNRVVKKHPEWAFMTEKEAKKLKDQKLRTEAFKLAAPFIATPGERKKLYLTLKRGI